VWCYQLPSSSAEVKNEWSLCGVDRDFINYLLFTYNVTLRRGRIFDVLNASISRAMLYE
jgi:hypothetical protein